MTDCEERSNSFFDEIDEREIVNEFSNSIKKNFNQSEVKENSNGENFMGSHLKAVHDTLLKDKKLNMSDNFSNDLHEIEANAEFEKEASFYALDSAQSLYDVANTQFKSSAAPKFIQTLRVMHCAQLTELRGINLFVNVRELNISSNNVLSMNGLEGLRQVEDLNLSCNKIS